MFNIDIDPAGALRALDRLGAAADRYLKAAAQITAERIAAEARSRVARRTGQTAGSIVAEESRDGKGYVVFVRTAPEVPFNLDIWIEFGTKHQVARPFLHPSVRLELGPHSRRIAQAIEDALGEAQG